MSKQTVREIDLKGKRALVRVDFNVPLDKTSGAITDDSRIRAALPTIDFLRDRGARVILCSHLGRPEGKVVEKLRLRPIAARLQEVLGAPVATADDCVGPEVAALAAGLPAAGVLLLENLRFHAEEEANDPAFAAQLAGLAEIYVNDAFGTAHRAHASTEGVAHLLPAVAGLLLERELEFLSRVTENPPRPYAAIVGGAKVSDKIGVLRRLVGVVDRLIIGGGMANTFLRAQGFGMGASMVEEDQVETAKTILSHAAARDVLLKLPVDVAAAERFERYAPRTVYALNAGKKGELPAGWSALDIGPETMLQFGEAIRGCATIVWNGPLGVFEFPNFALGTMYMADAVGNSGALTVVGGGETVAAIHEARVAERISHISTGGGASLEFLEGRELPGVAALLDKN